MPAYPRLSLHESRKLSAHQRARSNNRPSKVIKRTTRCMTPTMKGTAPTAASQSQTKTNSLARWACYFLLSAITSSTFPASNSTSRLGSSRQSPPPAPVRTANLRMPYAIDATRRLERKIFRNACRRKRRRRLNKRKWISELSCRQTCSSV